MRLNREMRKQLDRENAKRSETLTPVPRDQWQKTPNSNRIAVFISRKYLVQVFDEKPGVQRLSINRTAIRTDGRWDDGLTWDEIQAIKNELGLGDKYAIEIYPRDCDVVNVANMRHLWVLDEPLTIGWFKEQE
jgi:hypothetical protein